MPGTRKLGRPTAHRNAMLRGQVTYLFKYGKVETTITRAKEVRAMAEKMITLAKENTLASRRAALAYITEEDVVTKLFAETAPKYEKVAGGYTAIYKLGPRRGDAAEMALITLVKTAEELEAEAKAKKKGSKKTAAKAEKAAKAEEKAAEAPKAEETAATPAEEAKA